jgi:hypothetical protein
MGVEVIIPAKCRAFSTTKRAGLRNHQFADWVIHAFRVTSRRWNRIFDLYIAIPRQAIRADAEDQPITLFGGLQKSHLHTMRHMSTSLNKLTRVAMFIDTYSGCCLPEDRVTDGFAGDLMNHEVPAGGRDPLAPQLGRL